jgi:hypothetical protein
MPKKHAMKANAGAGFCSMTGRYVSLSHAATAPPREFRIPFWLPLGEGRLTTFWARDAAFGAAALKIVALPRGEAVWYCERLVSPGKRGRGRCRHHSNSAKRNASLRVRKVPPAKPWRSRAIQ